MCFFNAPSKLEVLVFWFLNVMKIVCAYVFILCASSVCAHEHVVPKLPKIEWSFDGFRGVFKRDQLQRGFQVYKEVCAACHGVKRVAYRNLASLGFSEAEVKALAAAQEVSDGPDAEGKMFRRPALPKDVILSPFPNDNAARAANNGSLPPDLSLIIKARTDGANYVYALLTGYAKPPAGISVGEGQHYNLYFPGNQLSMAAPLRDGAVSYGDGTVASVSQMAKDVVAFLAWTAEPEMEERKQLGVKVFLYLVLMTGLFYATMRRIWSRVR